MPPVTVPEPLIDKDQLNESERQLVELFESRAASSSQPDDASPISAEDEAETTGTPGSPATPPAAPGVPTTVEGQSGAPESAPSQATEPLGTDGEPIVGATPPDTSTAAPVEGEPTSDESAQSSPAFTFAGVNYTPNEVVEAVRIRDWYRGLNNPQLQAIDALLSGQYRLVPADEAAPVVPTQQTASPQATPSAPSVPPDSPVVGDGAEEWLDPQAQAAITRLQNELDAMRQQFTQTVTPIVETQQSQIVDARMQAIDQAAQQFRDDYSLPDDQVQLVSQAVVDAGIFPSLLQRNNGDASKATRAALEMMFWTTPTFRDPYMQSKTQNDLVTLSQEHQATLDRQRKQTALSGSGGSVPRSSTTPSTTTERQAAMVEAIRADMNGQ